jgi:hypothetical protein
MANIKLKNILAENMRRFNTKNLKEASYTASELRIGSQDYFFNNKSFRGYVHPEDMIDDLHKADIENNGSVYARIGVEFLKYLQDPDTIELAQRDDRYSDAIEDTNQYLIKMAIVKLKKDPKDKMAQQTIKDEISDFWSWID